MTCPRLFEPVEPAHLETCAECRAFAEAMNAPAPAVDLDRLKGPALDAIERSPRTQPWWLGAAGLAVIVCLAAVAGVGGMSSSTTQHASMLMRNVSTLAWAATMFAAALLAVMPGSRTLRTLLLASVSACFALTLAAASGYEAGAGVKCALIEAAVAALPMFAALGVLTGFAFDATRALAAGVAASAAGMLAVHLHCPDGSIDHQVVFHLAPVFVLALLTLALRRFLPSRTHAP
ncbi:MAG: hypothetical protein JNK82_27835 [Myxococcaceae bacterium]|nr:hypothetical protein [Myxococcaceae bacterium]